MTTYETIMIVLAVLTLIMTIISLLVKLLLIIIDKEKFSQKK